MDVKDKIRKALSIVLSATMLLNMGFFGTQSDIYAAAKGYDVRIMKVGLYKQSGVIKAYADVKNVGTGNVATAVPVRFYVDREKIGEGTVASGLNTNATSRVTIDLTKTYSGVHAVTAVAIIEDDSVSNNNATSRYDMNVQETTTHVPPTVQPTTVQPTTVQPTTIQPTTVQPTTVEPTTVEPTTVEPTTVDYPDSLTDIDRSGWSGYASDNNNNANKALDDNYTSRWDTGKYQAASPEMWYVVDLGENYTYDRIVLDTGTSGGGDQPAAYEVYALNSFDPSNPNVASWSNPIATGTNPNQVLTKISVYKQTTRYIAIKQTGAKSGRYWSIHEFYAYDSSAVDWSDSDTLVGARLDVTGLSCSPADPVAGNNVSFTATVRNTGDVAATNAPVQVTINGTTLNGTVNVNAFSSSNVTVTGTWTAVAGNYTARATTTYNNISSYKDLSVVVTEPTTEAPQNMEAQVVALSYEGTKDDIEAGDTVTFKAAVKNTGDVAIPAGTQLSVAFGVDGNSVASVTTSSAIAVGQFAEVQTTWNSTIGGHTVTATLGESSVSKRFNVTKAINRSYTNTSGKDLYITDIGWINETTGIKNGGIAVGDKVRFIAYTVNIGTVATGSNQKHGLVFSFNGSTWNNGGTTYNDTFYGPLQPNEFKEQVANGGQSPRTDGCWVAVNGTTSIEARSDDSNNVVDEVKGNNTKTISLTIPYNVNMNATVDSPDPVDWIVNHGPLGEISGLSATSATRSAINLTWTAAANATSYNIYDSNDALVGNTTSTSYRIPGTFTVGNSYTYRVRAVQTVLDVTTQSTGLTVAPTITAGTEVQAYPTPQGFTESTSMSMTVNDENVEIFKTRVSEIHNYPSNNWKSDKESYIGIFDYEGGAADVKITVNNRTDINSVTVRPVSDGVTATPTVVGGNTVISMTIPDGKQGQYDLEFNGNSSYNNTIFLFTNDIDEAPANPWKTVRSGEKLTGHVEVPDGETLYIEGGGVIEGYVHMGNNSQLLGRGVISQKTSGSWAGTNRNNPLSIGYEPLSSGSEGGSTYGRNYVTVEGITILDPVGWALNVRNSHDVTIKDVNIITATSNGDGITIQSSYNVDVEGCFVRSFDDSLVIKNYDNINSHNIKFTNCVIWTDLAQSMEIGYETNMGGYNGRVEAGLRNYDPRIYNILFNDIDVIHNYHKDVMSIHNANYARVYHIGYKDIRVEQHSGGMFANGDDYNEFGNYSFGTNGDGGVHATDVNFDNVPGYESSWGTQTNINPNTFFN
jgi:hypothetical protein